ncbi:unnamed protein product [Blumeria hordei]|uniref:Long chronological lifespan protein 2 n=2 Tax=Blumeria hordei TaxID=2867405 RepID=A0A383UKV4_BLUHO|nr:hypothetical protein BGHDH14_bgh05195 [Blumeria hordei DH14]SZE99970.1 unnamed protein product [Blumeria hordei]
MARIFLTLVTAAIFYFYHSNAQFEFFEQMFSNHHEQQHHQPQNSPPDSAGYQTAYDDTYCTNYLCPDTLACVESPNNCPCPHPRVEEKFVIGEGKYVCISKGGFKPGEAARKLELARKGLL